jgi:hypothetical protein
MRSSFLQSKALELWAPNAPFASGLRPNPSVKGTCLRQAPYVER